MLTYWNSGKKYHLNNFTKKKNQDIVIFFAKSDLVRQNLVVHHLPSEYINLVFIYNVTTEPPKKCGKGLERAWIKCRKHAKSNYWQITRTVHGTLAIMMEVMGVKYNVSHFTDNKKASLMTQNQQKSNYLVVYRMCSYYILK